jgi:multidrug efflux pump subunit AcrA (membrane-fusion protein)
MASSSRKVLFFAGLLAFTGISIAYLANTRTKPPVKPIEESSWIVDVETLTLQDLVPEISLLGEVKSSGLTLISSRINADVIATPQLAGNRVVKGAELLVLDPTDAQANLSQKQADVAELEASVAEEMLRYKFDQEALVREQNLVELTQKSLTRQKQLVKNNVASQERVEVAEIALEQQQLGLNTRTLVVNNHTNRLKQLQAKLLRARALLAVAEQDFTQTRLQAPFDGWITEVFTAPGNRVRIGDRLLEVLADNSLEVAAQIPDNSVATLREAIIGEKELSAYADIFGNPVELKLTRLSARANVRTAGVDAFFSPVKPDTLTLGKSVSIQVRMPVLKSVFALPVSALYGDTTLYHIENGRLMPAEIRRLGRFRNADGQERLIFQADRLQPGMQVVLTQIPNAVTGLKVNPRVAPAGQEGSL